MLNLLLIGCFTAFLLALTVPLLDILSMFVNGVFMNAFASLCFSLLATLFLDYSHYKTVIVTTVAGAFLGSLLLAVAERISQYKPAVINPTRTNG